MDDLLPWGLEWRDLERAARGATLRAHPGPLPFADRYDTALSAVCEAVMVSTQPPAYRDLFMAGVLAIDRLREAEYRHHGIPYQDGMTGRRYTVYWHGARGITCSFTDDVDDKLAARQVWADLSDIDREALATLGDFGDLEASAHALGLSLSAYKARLRRARVRARVLWHWPEPPSRFYSRNRAYDPDRDYTEVMTERIGQHKRRRRKAAA